MATIIQILIYTAILILFFFLFYKCIKKNKTLYWLGLFVLENIAIASNVLIYFLYEYENSFQIMSNVVFLVIYTSLALITLIAMLVFRPKHK